MEIKDFFFKMQSLKTEVIIDDTTLRDGIQMPGLATSPKDAAKIANYSPNYFNNQFKAYTGMTFKQYLNDLRLSFSKNLLYYTELPITQVCYECGFNDFSHFMSIFKKKFGVTPKRLRDYIQSRNIK